MTRAIALPICAAVVIVVHSPTPLSASEPTDHLDPARQGSLVDVGNALEATQSDAGLRSDGPPLSAGAGTNGCSAAMLKPFAEADVTSPTGVAVTTRFSFQCLLATGGTDTFQIEYLTLDGWRPAGGLTATIPGNGGLSGGPLRVPCRAGTWHYRGRAEGTIDLVTASTLLTCVRASDIGYIDPP